MCMKKSIAAIIISVCVLYGSSLFAQTIPEPAATTYPRTKAYLSFIIPWVTTLPGSKGPDSRCPVDDPGDIWA